MSDTVVFDYSAPPLLPVQVTLGDRGVELAAGGQVLRFIGALFNVESDGPVKTAVSQHRLDDGNLVSFSLAIQASGPALLRQVRWFAGEWESGAERVVNSSSLQDNILFLRKHGISFLLSLDFPFSRIDASGISYPPSQPLAAGEVYHAHSVTVAACRLSGCRVGALDRAEIEAASAYIERRFPLRFERPVHISCSITNRLTYCREDRVYYSMRDNPTLGLNPKLLEEDLRLMAEIGVEYFQVFEGVFDWPDPRRASAALQRLVRLGRRLGVRVGDYFPPHHVHCQHFNYFNRDVQRPEWLRRNADGTTRFCCLGCRPYVESFRAQLVESNRRHGEEMICFDFLDAGPCFAENHGHPPGDIYQQVLAMVSLCAELNALSPDYLIWSNSGNWIEFMPKLVWWNQSVYLTDPHVRNYAPTLSALKLLGDGRREQMVTVHEKHLVPYRFFTNCEYYAFPRSRETDVRVFEYSFLQGLAVTPNICPAEVRTFFNRIPAPARRRCAAFMRRWMDFTRRHFGVWKHTARVGDAPGVGAAEAYAHVSGNAGFICLLNQNPYPVDAAFALDGSIGLSAGSEFVLREVYPQECPIAEQSLPGARFGDRIATRLPPYTVRYIAIEPHQPVEGLRVFGAAARVSRRKNGYRLALRAPQGAALTIGLVLPEGETLASARARQKPGVPLFTFEAGVRVLAQQGRLAWLEVTFPLKAAPFALTRWRVTPGDVEADLARVKESGFLGARFSGAFAEEFEVQVDLATGPAQPETAAARLPPCPLPPAAPAVTLPAAATQRFETELELSFIEPIRFGCMPGYDDDTLLELAFRDCERVKNVRAEINGKGIEVRRFPYPRRPEWHSFYIELTGAVDPGHLQLAVEVDWH